MAAFLFIFLALYASMNFYLFRKVYIAFPGHKMLLLILGGAGVSLPILGRLLDRHGAAWLARICGGVGYTWMVWVFWFLLLGLIFDIWNLGARVAVRRFPGALGWTVPARSLVIALGIVIAGLTILAVWEASRIRIVRVDVDAPQLEGDAPLRIAVISDLHLSLTLRGRRLDQVVRLVEQTQPDMFVSLGDMVDASFEQMRPLAEHLARVRPPMGKYAILGNHEFYSGLDNSLPFLETAGFTLLRGESVSAGRNLRVAGVDDITAARWGMKENADDGLALAGAREGEFVLFLKHRPEIGRRAEGRFHLILCGHTHGGQIFPFWQLAVRQFYPTPTGLHRAGENAWLYLSRGTGTWGPRMRLFAPPEVTLVTLRPGNGASVAARMAE